MAWRRKVEELEADLFRVPLPRFFRFEKGEVERKRFEDGTEELEVRFHGLRVPDGTTVILTIADREVCPVMVRGGRGRVDLSSSAGREVPSARSGDVVEVRSQGQALLRGTLRPD